MTDEQINAAIAEACGLKKPCRKVKLNDKGFFVTQHAKLPNYCADLNAMHEAEKVLAPRTWNNYSEKWWNYSRNLACISDGRAIHATARERAEAFLRTLGKWDHIGDVTEIVKEVQK